MNIFDFMYYYSLVKSYETELKELMDYKRGIDVLDNTTRKKLFREMIIVLYGIKGKYGGVYSYPSCLTRMILNGLIDDSVYKKYLCMIDENNDYQYSKIEK